jgi:formylglycine-generating enzyme
MITHRKSMKKICVQLSVYFTTTSEVINLVAERTKFATRMLALVMALLFLNFAHAQQSTFTNSIGMEFILIPQGKMTIGNYKPAASKYGFIEKHSKPGDKVDVPIFSEEEYIKANELATKALTNGFIVQLDRPYYICKFEVTQAQWKKLMGVNPSYFQGTKVKDTADQHPVESVGWNDAIAFIKKLNQLEAGKHSYRLPTEFEWEYAARAGVDDDIAWEDIQEVAQIALLTTMPVGLKKPNANGLYDMLGNVWEWTSDFYNEKIFADSIPAKSGKEHVMKGAPFYGDVKNATYMTHAGGPGSNYDVGFRVVMEVGH